MRKFLFTLSLLFLQIGLFANTPIIVNGSYDENSPLSSEEERQEADLLKNTLKEIAQNIQENHYNTAIVRAKDLLDKRFTDPRLYVAIAYAYEQLALAEDADVNTLCREAIYNASQAIAKQPSSVEAFTTRAHCYYLTKNMPRAIQDIEEALKLNPKSTRAEAIKEIIYTNPINPKRKANNQKNNDIFGGLPHWFLFYFVGVILLIVMFLIIKYRKPEYVDNQGRKLKEYNIKEQYQFIRSIGEGGMGKVYEAYDNTLKRKVAVKRIKPELLKNSVIRDQFLAEARTVAMLRHPSIVEIYTVIETTTSLYLVFEYVDGQTLETRLDIDGYIPFAEVKEIFRSICAGLAYAHSLDIVHCDLKPGNIMISDLGVAKVMDFGVAQKIIEGKKDSNLSIAGTPAYMSPEQQKGYTDKQSDIYSLGVCLYESLVGAVPWTVQGYDLNTKKIVPPSELLTNLGPDVDNLLIRALEQDPTKRIQSIEEFWALLDACKEKV